MPATRRKNTAAMPPAASKPAANKPMMTNRSGSPVPPGFSTPAPTRANVSAAQIAEAAYFLWQRRGGDALSNWLEAESNLRRNGR